MECLICKSRLKNANTLCQNCLDLFEKRQDQTINKIDHIDQVYIGYYYHGLLKESILKFKFSNERHLAKAFGEILSDYIIEEGIHKNVDLMLAVPLHKTSMKKRGYNQADLICKEIEKNLQIKYIKDNLVKIRHTKEQARLGLDDRRLNVKDAFSLKDPKKIANKKVLIVDDLVTSGATMENCAKVLKEAGASHVIGLGLASAR